MQPLWLSSDAQRPIYPVRLTALMKSYINLLIYVLANHRMRWEGYEFAGIEFAGETKLHNLSVQESETDLVDLLTDRSYFLTKLEFPSFRPDLREEDLYFERADSDEPYGIVDYRTRYLCPPATETPPTKVETPTERSADQRPGDGGCLGLGVSLVLLGLLAGLGVAWRRLL